MTNADLDHVLGLFSLREGAAFCIYATAAIKAATEEGLGLASALNCFCSPCWVEPQFGGLAPLPPTAGREPELLYEAIELTGNPPPFARGLGPAIEGVQSVAYQFQDRQTGKRLLVAPDVGEVNGALEEAMRTADAVLFDGTFWSAEELSRVRPGAKKAADMGHLTIEQGSLHLLSKLRADRKIYIHINNTNPIWAADSPERAAVERAGITVGRDGLEFEL